jgi:hypothetical protein
LHVVGAGSVYPCGVLDILAPEIVSG